MVQISKLSTVIFFSFAMFISYTSISQEFESISFVGYENEEVLLLCRQDGKNRPCSLNENEMQIELKDINSQLIGKNELTLVYFSLESQFNWFLEFPNVNPYPFVIELSNIPRTFYLDFDYNATAFDLVRFQAYLASTSDIEVVNQFPPNNLIELDLTNGETREIPIKAMDPIIVQDYLFYADYHDVKNFDLVYDIYRVKIGDWENPQRIFIKNYRNGWRVTPDGKYLIVEIISGGYSPTCILFNIETKKYSILETKFRKRPTFYSYLKNAICFYDHSISSKEQEVERFHYIPIPESFPYTPDWAMEFGDSFINHYWIEEAPEDSLRTLDKSQLRLLRNSVFARRGWRFADQALADFFSQFEWYRDQLERNQGNDKIQLTNSDKYRSNLILKIENEK